MSFDFVGEMKKIIRDYDVAVTEATVGIPAYEGMLPAVISQLNFYMEKAGKLNPDEVKVLNPMMSPLMDELAAKTKAYNDISKLNMEANTQSAISPGAGR